jgi:hypothetical protein
MPKIWNFDPLIDAELWEFFIYLFKGALQIKSRWKSNRNLYLCISRIGQPILLSGKHVDQSWKYINHSQTSECRNWDWSHAIPRKGIHKWDFPCSVPNCEIFNPSDFHDFYTMWPKRLSGLVTLGLKYELITLTFGGARQHLICWCTHWACTSVPDTYP